MGNVPLSTPNAKTTLGLTAQVVCGKTVTQENYTGKLDVSILNRGGGQASKPVNLPMSPTSPYPRSESGYTLVLISLIGDL